jgi:hypothetical protein
MNRKGNQEGKLKSFNFKIPKKKDTLRYVLSGLLSEACEGSYRGKFQRRNHLSSEIPSA